MLKGLEISEVSFSNLESIKFRLDSEYYQQKYLALEAKIKAIGEIDIRSINGVLDCSAFYPSITGYYDFEGNGVPFLRVNEIQNGLVVLTENTAYLPQRVLDNNRSTIAIGHPGDIVIAKGGNTLAKVGLITDQFQYCALSRDVILLRTANLEGYNKYFLWVFLHSSFGQDLLWRTASQTGQPHLTLPSVNEIGLPRYDLDFENRFEALYESSVKLKSESQSKYQEALTVLIDSLDMKRFNPSKQQVNEKSFKESFLSSGRLDAEFYHQKFDDLFVEIKKCPNYEKIKDIRKSNYRGLQPVYVENGTLDVINSKHIREQDLNYSGFEKTNKIHWDTQYKARVFKNDILTYTTGANIGRTQTYMSDNRAIASNHVNVLRLQDGFNAQYVGFVMNSYIGRMQTDKLSAGSAQAELYPKHIDEFIIPLVDTKIQVDIVNLLNASQNLRNESQKLLDIAKQAIEVAIEKGEQEASKIIDEGTIQHA